MSDSTDPGRAPTATADDVAARAGVSRWTVARAFKKDASISEASRRRVMDAAGALGYVPDLSAASLSAERSNLVALLVDDFDNPHKLVMLERLTRILRRAGIGTLLVNMLGEADAPDALLSASQRRVDAAVLIGTQFDESIRRTALGARRIRKVVVFARTGTGADTISIGCDDAAAMRLIADHVIARGHLRPLFLAGPTTESTRLLRKDSFARLWTDRFGAPVPAVHVARYAADEACAGLTRYLTAIDRATWPDVVVCENDVLALGACDALRYRLGLSIPGDIAVTGFDDIPLAAAPGYDLTTIRQPITKMAEVLVQLLERGEDGAAQYVLEGTFVPAGFVLKAMATTDAGLGRLRERLQRPHIGSGPDHAYSAMISRVV